MAKRGVQQEDVDGAADALLMEGQRPTVERVRMKIGSGSPNNVGPMLESWFGRLGRRVAGMPPEGPGGGLPMAAQNAFRLLWETALAEAKGQAEASLAGERDLLHRDRVALAEERIAFEGRRGALEENVRLAQAQTKDAREQLAESTEIQRAQSVTLDQARQHATELEQQLGQTRSLLDAQTQAHAQEREKTEARATANERRHLREIDVARADGMKLSEQLTSARSAEEAARSKASKLREQLAQLQQTHAVAISDLARTVDKEAAAQQLHQAAQERVEDLQSALNSERTQMAELRQQLLTATKPRRRLSAKKPATNNSMLRKRNT
jgi:hypothetical protein